MKNSIYNQLARTISQLTTTISQLTCIAILILIPFAQHDAKSETTNPSEGRTSNALQKRAFDTSQCKTTLNQSTIYYKAVGSIQPRIQASVMAQTSGQILEMTAAEGSTVQKGELLVTIEDRQLSLALSQARNSVSEAEAGKRQTESNKLGAMALADKVRLEYERVKKMHSKKAATDQMLEQAEASYKQTKFALNSTNEAIKGAQASVQRALDGVAEIKISLGYTKVKAPFAGTISKKFVEPGDLAWPGRPIYRLIDLNTMRMEANVRESLAGKLYRGQKLTTTVDALNKSFAGVIEEIVPSADSLSRTFIVKVTIETDERLLPGMFGRLLIPVKTKATVTIPEECIQKFGQLKIVYVKEGNSWIKRLIKTGEQTESGIIVLSGLTEGETVSRSNPPANNGGTK